jgi:hypothetical protein
MRCETEACDWLQHYGEQVRSKSGKRSRQVQHDAPHRDDDLSPQFEETFAQGRDLRPGLKPVLSRLRTARLKSCPFQKLIYETRRSSFDSSASPT